MIWKSRTTSSIWIPTGKLYPSGGAGSHHWALKNRIEFKTGQGILVWGNRFAWSWHDADQTGSMFLLTAREIKLRNITVENNLFQHSYGFLQWTGRNTASDSSGLSYVSQGLLVRNNMIWAASDPNLTASPGVIKALPTATNDSSFTCSAARSAGITTVSNCSSLEADYTYTEAGDWIRLESCSDSSFNVAPAEVLASNPLSLGPLTIAQAGANAGGVTCTLHVDSGTPRGSRFENNTIITEGVGSYRNLFLYANDINQESRQVTVKNNIFVQTTGTAGNVIYCTTGGSGGNEGSGAAYAGACYNRASLELHHNLIRPSANLTPGRYSDWFPRGTEDTSHPATWFPANLSCSGSYTASCPGFLADYATGSRAADYHDYTLNAASYYAAGHAGQGDDGKDLGVNLAELDAAMVQNVYTCRSDCTNGGTSHGPYPHYVSSAQAPSLTESPASLSFAFTLAGSNPASQPLAVGSTQSPVSFTASTSAAWLSAIGSGTTPRNVTVSVNPAGLAAGTYHGTVTLASGQANNCPLSVPVTLTIYPAAPTSLTASPSSLAFSFTVGGSNPASKTLAVGATGSSVSYTLSTSGGSWLSATGEGSTPRNVTVSVNPAGLTAGTYTGAVALTSAQAQNSPLSVPITFTVSSGGGGGGVTWEPVNTPACGQLRYISFKADGTIFVACRVEGFFRSTNGGASWTQINSGIDMSGSHLGWIIKPNPSGTVIIAATAYTPATSNAVKWYRSTNNGDNWSLIPGSYNYSIVPTLSGPVWTSTGRMIFGGYWAPGGHASSAAYSDNDGASSAEATSNPQETATFGFGVHPATHDIWLGTEAAGIYKSTDNGASYSFVFDDDTIFGNNRNFAFLSDGRIVVCTGDGIARSTNSAGSSWAKVFSNGKRCRDLIADAGDNLYETHAGGSGVATSLYRSADGGTTWSAFDDGLPRNLSVDIEKLAINPTDGRLWAAPDGTTLYRTVNAVQ